MILSAALILGSLTLFNTVIENPTATSVVFDEFTEIKIERIASCRYRSFEESISDAISVCVRRKRI
jgi:hypothetical protein